MTNSKDDQRYTGLQGHVREGKVLVPPLMTIPGLRLTSWMNSRLPEFIWVGLLQSAVPRLEVLDGLRGLGPTFERVGSPRNDLSLTGIASPTISDEVIPALCRDVHWRAALAPLKLFPDLPGLEVWARLLPEPDRHDGWRSLRVAAASMLYHQSEVATDARWACLFAKITSGFVRVTSASQEQTLREIVAYPREGDLRKIRPTIRSMDAAFIAEEEDTTAWSARFWNHCLASTECYPLASSTADLAPTPTVSTERVAELRSALLERCVHTRTCSAVDPRHDGAFGLVLYACSLLGELAVPGQGDTILSRLGLRTLLEATITLSYLVNHGSPENWSEFRSFGAGQAKLALLKLSGVPDAPTSVDLPSLEALASEDAWLEFVKVDLSTWAKKDLRRLSDQCGLKDLYDRFYPWTSAYAHAQWHATRDVVFDTCGNPLHRLHRIPRSEKRTLPSAVGDAARLVDTLVCLIEQAFPGAQPLPTLLPRGAAAASPEEVESSLASGPPLAAWQETLLALQAQVFEAFTGVPPERFVPDGQSFGQAINALGAAFKADGGLADRRIHEGNAALRALVEHYSATGKQRLDAAKSISGTKCVLGGQQSLTEAGAEAALCSAAYFDTVLVPDPVHRWLEVEPTQERFAHVRMLEDIYNVARLRIAGAQQGTAMLLFPSLEKFLEHKDPTTQDGIGRLITDVCSGVLGVTLADPQELAAWAAANEQQFLAAVSERGLFVPCGGSPGMPPHEAVKAQRRYLSQWRSPSFHEAYGKASDALVALMSIGDRLAPVFHLLDNAASFDACPVLFSPIQWHYFRLCFSVESSRLLGDVSMPLFPETVRALDDLADRARPGTSDFSPGDLFSARAEARFLTFRKSLRGLLSLLDVTTGSGLDGLLRTVALELPRLLSSLELGDRGGRAGAEGVAPPRVAAVPWLPMLGARTTAPRPLVAPRVLLGRVPIGFYFPERDD